MKNGYDAVVKMRNIVKHFYGVTALNQVDFDIFKGEVHCLVGENGAGKSTLMKVLAGVYQCDGGEIFFENIPVKIENPNQSKNIGINVIYQELELIPTLSVAENIFIANEMVSKSLIQWKKMEQAARELLITLGIDIDPKKMVGDLSVAQQQLVTIAKAVSRKSKVIIMDEPSAVLSGKPLDLLFRTIRNLKEKNIGIVYISHHLAEIFAIGDKVTIMRDAKIVSTKDVKDITIDETIQTMIGRKLNNYYFKKEVEIGEEVFCVKNLNQGKLLKNISFKLHRKEVLGFFGLIGSGRTELARSIIGAEPIDEGEISLFGKKLKITSPKKALSLKIAYLPESRRDSGLLMLRSVGENISLPILNNHKTKFLALNFKKIIAHAKKQITKLNIRPPLLGYNIANFSGGNQQKVVFAKLLGAGCNILILDEPTRGIDVGTKEEIYHLISDIIEEGKSIILISSELPEIKALSDRIIIINEGKIVKEVDPKKTTEEEMLRLAIPFSISKKAQGS